MTTVVRAVITTRRSISGIMTSSPAVKPVSPPASSSRPTPAQRLSCWNVKIWKRDGEALMNTRRRLTTVLSNTSSASMAIMIRPEATEAARPLAPPPAREAGR